jgi:transposase
VEERGGRYSSVGLYCQDESRFGLFTRAGRGVTAKGVKPVSPFQQVFHSTYLFGAYSPVTGDHFELELPACTAAAFQVYLDEFSFHRPDELKIMVLDNGAFHKAKCLRIPDDIVLIFLPPYAPELNPAEKIWWRMKRNFSGKVFSDLDALSIFIEQEVKALTEPIVRSICAYNYFFTTDIWSNVL